jgi:putative two-component system response regulator
MPDTLHASFDVTLDAVPEGEPRTVFTTSPPRESARAPRSPHALASGIKQAIAFIAEFEREPAATRVDLLHSALAQVKQIPAPALDRQAAELLLRIAALIDHYSVNEPSFLDAVELAQAWARREGCDAVLCTALRERASACESYAMSEAVSLYAEATEAASRIGDQEQMCRVLGDLGIFYLRAALYANARACFESILGLVGNRRSRRWDEIVWRTLDNLADTALRQGRFEEACEFGRRCLDWAERNDAEPPDNRLLTDVHAVMARAWMGLGDLDRARDHVQASCSQSKESRSAVAEYTSGMALALFEVRQGQFRTGLAHIQRLIQWCRSNLRHHQADALSLAVSAYEQAGQSDVALVYLHELQEMNRQLRTAGLGPHLDRLVRTMPLAPTMRIEVTWPELQRHRGQLRGMLAKADREHLAQLNQLVESQAIAAERLDDATGEHCHRVGRLAALLAHEIGLEPDVCFLIDLAARLHDIGKLQVPDAILLKPGKLSPGEFEIMKSHTTAGSEILGMVDIPQMHIAQEIARHHHERWDGSGYPDGLKGSAIPVAARVSTLADVFDALTHERPYKPAWSLDAAMTEIAGLAGRQFDPDIVPVFLALVERQRREFGDLDALLGRGGRQSDLLAVPVRIAQVLERVGAS